MSKTENSQLYVWRNACRKELATAKEWQDNWGFLKAQDDSNTPPKDYVHVPTKYTKGGTTVVHKRIPVEPHEHVTLDSTSTSSSSPTWGSSGQVGGMTAIQSTLRSHSTIMARIKTEDPFYKTTSSVYGSRLPVEQFGIAHHAVHETAVTHIGRREFCEQAP